MALLELGLCPPEWPVFHYPEAWNSGCKGIQPLSNLFCFIVAAGCCSPDTSSMQALDHISAWASRPSPLQHCPPGMASSCPTPRPPPQILPSWAARRTRLCTRVQPWVQRPPWSPQGSIPSWVTQTPRWSDGWPSCERDGPRCQIQPLRADDNHKCLRVTVMWCQEPALRACIHSHDVSILEQRKPRHRADNKHALAGFLRTSHSQKGPGRVLSPGKSPEELKPPVPDTVHRELGWKLIRAPRTSRRRETRTTEQNQVKLHPYMPGFYTEDGAGHLKTGDLRIGRSQARLRLRHGLQAQQAWEPGSGLGHHQSIHRTARPVWQGQGGCVLGAPWG